MSRRARPSAPGFAERSTAVAAIRRWSDARAEERPGSAERIAFLEREARAAVSVARARSVPQSIDGDAGPRAAGRGALETGPVLRMVYSPRADDLVVTATDVVRRRRSPVLAALSPGLRETAERYAQLHEIVGAMRGVDLTSSGGGGGRSDGGAVARVDDAHRLARAVRAIGKGAVMVRRVAGAGRAPTLTAIGMVDLICVCGWSVDSLLASHGWSRRQDHRDRVKAALVAALERAQAVLG